MAYLKKASCSYKARKVSVLNFYTVNMPQKTCACILAMLGVHTSNAYGLQMAYMEKASCSYKARKVSVLNFYTVNMAQKLTLVYWPNLRLFIGYARACLHRTLTPYRCLPRLWRAYLEKANCSYMPRKISGSKFYTVNVPQKTYACILAMLGVHTSNALRPTDGISEKSVLHV